jgi:hypothetical protein
MLDEIQSDAFKEAGVIRPAIRFHKGLNVVVGPESGNNSIGKSTLLLIIDFVLGGDDYLTKDSAVTDHVGVHAINFKMTFGGVPYRFSRSTGDPNKIYPCDEDYTKRGEPWTIAKYLSFLKEQYGFGSMDISFRQAISPFLRVYQRETHNELKPLQEFEKEKNDVEPIRNLLKLFGRYAFVKDESDKAEYAKNRYQAVKKNAQFDVGYYSITAKQFKENQKRLGYLQKQLDELTKESSDGLLSLDSLEADRLSEVRRQLSEKKRARAKYQTELNAITPKEGDDEISKESFDALKEFFPDTNIAALERIKAFHNDVSGFLKEEYSERADILRGFIHSYDIEIQNLYSQLDESNAPKTASEAMLKEFSLVKSEFDRLTSANKAYTDKIDFKQNDDDAEKAVDAAVLEQNKHILPDLNKKMESINDTLYKQTKTSPVMEIPSADEYRFFTPDDGGTGTQYRGLIVFDIAMMELTKVPAAAHDSLILKNIDDEALESLFSLYAQSEKQFFIAFDKESSYTEKTKKLIDDNAVIKLRSGDGALFGEQWNVKKETK